MFNFVATKDNPSLFQTTPNHSKGGVRVKVMINFFATKNCFPSFKYNDNSNVSNIIDQNTGSTSTSDNNHDCDVFNNIPEVMADYIDTKEICPCHNVGVRLMIEILKVRL